MENTRMPESTEAEIISAIRKDLDNTPCQPGSESFRFEIVNVQYSHDPDEPDDLISWSAELEEDGEFVANVSVPDHYIESVFIDW